MALMDKSKGICIVDEVDGDELHARFDDAELVFNRATNETTGSWMEPTEDGEDWVFTPMTPAQVREYLKDNGIKAFAY